MNLKLEEAIADSPEFRAKLQRNEDEITQLEILLRSCFKNINVWIDFGVKAIETTSVLVTTYKEMVTLPLFQSERNKATLFPIIDRLTERNRAGRVNIEKFKTLKDVFRVAFDDIKLLKELRKSNEKRLERYENFLARFQMLLKKDFNLFAEEAFQSVESKKEYTIGVIEYMFAINNFKQVYDFSFVEKLNMIADGDLSIEVEERDQMKALESSKIELQSILIEEDLLKGLTAHESKLGHERFGYLFKRNMSKGTGSWKRTFLRLEDVWIYFSCLGKERGQVEADEPIHILLVEIKPLDLDRKYSFEMYSSTINFHLQAESESEYRNWIKCFEMAKIFALKSENPSILDAPVSRTPFTSIDCIQTKDSLLGSLDIFDGYCEFSFDSRGFTEHFMFHLKNVDDIEMLQKGSFYNINFILPEYEASFRVYGQVQKLNFLYKMFMSIQSKQPIDYEALLGMLDMSGGNYGSENVRCDCDEHLNTLVDEILPIEIEKLRDLLFGDDMKAPIAVFKKRKYHSVVQGDWIDGQRKNTYVMPISNPLVKAKEAECVEVASFFKDESDVCIVDVVGKSVGVPYSDNFESIVRYCLTKNTKGTRIAVSVKFNWFKSPFVKNIIKNATMKAIQEVVRDLLDEVTKYEKPLKLIVPEKKSFVMKPFFIAFLVLIFSYVAFSAITEKQSDIRLKNLDQMTNDLSDLINEAIKSYKLKNELMNCESNCYRKQKQFDSLVE